MNVDQEIKKIREEGNERMFALNTWTDHEILCGLYNRTFNTGIENMALEAEALARMNNNKNIQ